ncbi:MAG: substrate-binding domain-containing protein [Alkalibacterium sp.]|nr:substrate-binding domain-containing protein [Alkalibacterium sp.]
MISILRYPGDLSIAGYGGYDLLSFMSPALTTIKYPYFAIGDLAIETIEKMIAENRRHLGIRNYPI